MANAKQDDPSAIFAVVCEEFNLSVPKDVRQQIADFQKEDAESMIEQAKKLAQDKLSGSSRMEKALRVVAKISEELQPYFKVVEIFIQSRPEYASLIWGTLRFIFQVASNFSSFLKKIETFLLRMTHMLPNFERFLRTLQKRSTEETRASYPRLTQALAYIYSDLLLFCQRLCVLFNSSGGETVAKIKLFGKMAWRPFESEYADIIEKFELHANLFLLDMQAVSDIEAISFYSKWDEKMEHVISRLSSLASSEKAKDESDRYIGSEVQKLLKRLHAPLWAPAFERARDHRFPDSGYWLLVDPLFSMYNPTSRASKSKNVLFISAKPGYGKTTLAAYIIEHMMGELSVQSASVAFYFFDKRAISNTSHDAYRAILSQLIFSRRSDKTILDIASIARPSHDTGQIFASDSEVSDILHLFIHHLTNCVLVFDGVDECTDGDSFLRKVEQLATDNKHCTIILLGRPTIKLRRQLLEQGDILKLDESRNLADLKRYIEPQITDLVDNEDLIIPADKSLWFVVETIASKASGMFLWANLFIKYLMLPSLSISARWKAIEDPNKFRGLDELFEGILEQLKNEYPGPARVSIRRAMQWVMGAFRPLTIDELRAAIAQDLDKPFEEGDVVPNLAQALEPMSGALLEVMKDNTVRLIHVTLEEYLVTSSYALGSSFRDETVLDFRPTIVHCYILSTCVSYLCHTIPIGPYVKNSPDKYQFQKRVSELPLLRYSTQFWLAHFVEFLRQLDMLHQYQDCINLIDEVEQRLIALLSNKERYTSWIEASWHLNCQEEIWSIELPNVRFEIDSLKKLYSLLGLARREHEILDSSWRMLLKSHPEEIWQPSISAFTKSQLRVSSSGAKISPIINRDASTSADESVVILTQVSKSGHAVGILSLRKPRFHEKHKNLIATYQIRSISEETLLFETDIEVPRSEATTINAGEGYLAERFFINAFISPTLFEAIIGFTLIKLAIDESSTGGLSHILKYHLRILKEFLTGDIGNNWHKTPSVPPRRLFLSPSAEFLVLLQRSSQVEGWPIDWAVWHIDIFQDTNCRRNPTQPRFVWIGKQSMSDLTSSYTPVSNRGQTSSREPASQPPFEPVIQFHPFRPQLVYTTPLGTYLINIPLIQSPRPRSYQDPLHVYPNPLTHIHFSASGDMLFGTDDTSIDPSSGVGKVAILHLSQFQVTPNFTRPVILDYPDVVSRSFSEYNTLTSTGNTQDNQGANSIMFTDGHQVSILQRPTKGNALIQHVVSAQGAQGEMRSRTLLHLPQWLHENSTLTLLDPVIPSGSVDNASMRVLIGVTGNNSYSFEDTTLDVEGVELPAIFERTERSITERVVPLAQLLCSNQNAVENDN